MNENSGVEKITEVLDVRHNSTIRKLSIDGNWQQ
jgi:hypothetical protein